MTLGHFRMNLVKARGPEELLYLALVKDGIWISREDGGKIGRSRVHVPLAPVKHLADLRNTANSQRYSSIYEDQRPKIEDIERSDGKKTA